MSSVPDTLNGHGDTGKILQVKNIYGRSCTCWGKYLSKPYKSPSVLIQPIHCVSSMWLTMLVRHRLRYIPFKNCYMKNKESQIADRYAYIDYLEQKMTL